MKIMIVVSLFLLISCNGASAWYDGFEYRIPITIDNAGNPALEDYQFNVSLFGINESSIRVVNELYSSTVPHWCENETDGRCYELWFNVSVGSEINNDYYIYYGNDTVSSTSDYANTFTKKYNDSGLVLELHMDEGTGFSQTNDTSEEGNHGTLTNMNTTGNATSGWQGTDGGQWNNRSDVVFSTGDQLRFDGANDYVNCGNDASLSITDAITISAWVKVDSYPTGGEILKNVVGHDVGGYIFAIRNTQKISVYLSGVGGWYYSDSDIMLDDWILVSITWDGSHVRIYQNGVLNNTPVAAAGSITHIGDFFIGHGSSATHPTDRFFDGSMDEVRIYNRALLEDEIYRQYIRSKYVVDAPTVTAGEIEIYHEFVIGATSFYDELTNGLTDFRDSMGRYIVWGVLFFAVGLAFALFTKIKQTLIGGK